MNKDTKHSLKREYVGKNEGQIITPTCSCGWRGRGEPAYNDFQMTNVKEQENEHLLGARREREDKTMKQTVTIREGDQFIGHLDHDSAPNELWRRCREAYDLLLVRRVLKRLHRRRMLLTTRDRRAP